MYMFISCSECSEGSFDNEKLECDHCHTKYEVVIDGARTKREKKIAEVERRLDRMHNKILIFTYEPVKKKKK